MQSDFFSLNRQGLGQAVKGGLIVLSGYRRLQRGNDAAFHFEQESNFWYLTGIDEPDWKLIIDGDSEWLIAPDVEDIHRIFDGALSNEDASKISGVKKVISYDEGSSLMRTLAKKHSIAYTIDQPPWSDHVNFSLNPAVKGNWRLLERTFNSVSSCRKELARLRAIKQPEEIKCIDAAIKLTLKTFEHVKEVLPKLRYEYEIEAEFDYNFKKQQATHAYDPIIASGVNAVTLHYGKNDQRLVKNTFLLMDIGAKLHGYSADITRTFAVGKLSARKQDIHAAVERAHYEIISLIKPGVSLESYQNQSNKIMKSALRSVNLLKDENDIETYRKYFPHAVSHGLGIDVHDSLGGYHVFEPGMVLTVEPGVYIADEKIGIRIEDDILVTDSGHRNMSIKLSTAY